VYNFTQCPNFSQIHLKTLQYVDLLQQSKVPQTHKLHIIEFKQTKSKHISKGKMSFHLKSILLYPMTVIAAYSQ